MVDENADVEQKNVLIVEVDDNFRNGSYRDEKNSVPYGMYFYRAFVKDPEGKYLYGMDVFMTFDEGVSGTPAHATRNKTHTKSTPESADLYAAFSFTPTTVGTKSLKFSSPDCDDVTVDCEVLAEDPNPQVVEDAEEVGLAKE